MAGTVLYHQWMSSVIDIFETYGQLIWDTNTNAPHSVELLVRPKSGENIDIESFFANAFGTDLRQWFKHQLQEAILFSRTTGLECHVNLDSSTLDLHRVETMLMSFLKHHPEGPYKHLNNLPSVTIEITQVQGYPATHVVDKLKKGWFPVKIAMDDFGKNNLSEQIVQHVDMVKLDKSVINDIKTDALLRDYIVAMIELGKAEIVAEGVETIEDVKFYQDMGIHLFQGYYFHKPEPIETLQHIFRKEP